MAVSQVIMYTLPEIFSRVNELESDDAKVKRLLMYRSSVLSWYVKSVYLDDYSDIELPEYTSSKYPPGNTYLTLGNCYSRLDHLFSLYRSGYKSQAQRAMTLMLESISADEAKLVEDVIVGRQLFNVNISLDVWKKIYPQLLKDVE